ncbi:MAG: hypothetical protein Q9187_005122, partial [Circinaria calcarea]
MDPLSVLASTAALSHVVHNLYGICNSIRKETEERKVLGRSLDLVQSIITALDRRKQGSKLGQEWYQGLKALETPQGPLEQLKKALEDLEAELKATQEGWRRLGQKVRWQWDKEKFRGTLADIDDLCRRIDVVLSQDQWTLSVAHYDLSAHQQEKQQRDEDEALKREIVAWLSPLHFLARQKEIFENSFPTGDLLLKSDEFRTSLATSMLWSAGIRQVLSSIVVDHLQRKSQDPINPVICLYLNEKESRIHTPENLLGSLLKQLVQLRGPEAISEKLKSVYRRAKNIEAPPGLKEIRQTLSEYIADYDRVYLIVDGLNECSSSARPLLEHQLLHLHKEKLSLLVTLRNVEGRALGFMECDKCHKRDIRVYWNCEICRSLPNHKRFDVCQGCKDKNVTCNKDKSHELSEPYTRIEVEVITSDADLKQYIGSEIEKEIGNKGSEIRDPGRYPMRHGISKFGRECDDHPDLVEEIFTVVVAKAQGNFIFAKLYMNSLKAKKTLKKIKQALENLPEKLDNLYEDALKRIKSQEDRESGSVAIKVLSIVARTHRPLSFAELKHGLVVKAGDTDFDPEEDYDKDDILAMTQGLVTIGNDDIGIVRLFHHSLQVYLTDNSTRWLPTAEVDIAHTCLAYLKDLDAFSEPCKGAGDFEGKKKKYPFIAYASQYWGDHVRGAMSDPGIQSATMEFLQDPQRVAAYIQAAWYTAQGFDGWDVREGIDPLHICAWFGLSSIIKALDEEDDDFNVHVGDSTHWQTPLMYACRRGHIEVVRQLLELSDRRIQQGTRLVNLVSGRGRTALFECIMQNQEEIAEFLLTRKELEINAVQAKESNRTALMVAAQLGHTRIVQHLLGHPDIDVNLQDTSGYTALYIAAFKGFPDIVELLLGKTGIDVRRVDNEAGRSALTIAAETDRHEVVKLFLQHDIAMASLMDHHGGTAMLRGIEKQRDSVIRVMLEFDLDFNCIDNNNRSLLHGVSAAGYFNFIRLLKVKGVNQDAQDNDGFTPLHDASMNGRPQAAKVLLEELGANSSINDNYGRTPFRVAWEYGQTQLMSILKANNTNPQADPMLVPSSAELPIWALVNQGRLDLITKALTTRKSDFSQKEPGTENNILHCAAEGDSIAILQTLLQNTDISPDDINRTGRTPLHLAAYYGDLATASALIEHHANLDVQDLYTYTPLYVAQMEKGLTVAIALIEAGAKIDATKIDVQDMFFAAVELGNVKAIGILLATGAEVLGRNEEGQTAMQLATKATHSEMIQLLE